MTWEKSSSTKNEKNLEMGKSGIYKKMGKSWENLEKSREDLGKSNEHVGKIWENLGKISGKSNEHVGNYTIYGMANRRVTTSDGKIWGKTS